MRLTLTIVYVYIYVYVYVYVYVYIYPTRLRQQLAAPRLEVLGPRRWHPCCRLVQQVLCQPVSLTFSTARTSLKTIVSLKDQCLKTN